MSSRFHATVVVTLLCVGVCLLTLPARANAEREHVVKAGQSLGGIAKRYGVRVSQLAAANRMSIAGKLRLGQVLVVPSAGIVYVNPGESIAKIAREHAVVAEELAKHNKLTVRAPLRAGQRLVLPGFDSAGEANDATKRWGRPKRSGIVTMVRVWSRETRRVRMVDTNGRVRLGAISEMRSFLRPRLFARKRKDPHPRLLRLLSQVSEHFGGRTLQVVSGYRLPGGNTRETSRHVAGEAIDFRISGVPLAELRDYCQHFDHVGVGFYPRSHFVHLDVRRTSTRWTDWSLPGQPAQLKDPGRQPNDVSEDEVEVTPQAPASEDEKDEPTAEDDGLPPVDE